MQASLGLSQLNNIKNIVKKKIEIGSRYYKNLQFNNDIQILPPSNSFSKNIYWVVGIVIKNKKMTALNLSKKLSKFGIETRPFFWPMHQQSIFKKLGLFKNQKYPNSSYISKYGLYLPSYFELKKKEIDKISKTLQKILN
jgi:perosamine synthetase